jgi:hypothetical protein
MSEKWQERGSGKATAFAMKGCEDGVEVQCLLTAWNGRVRLTKDQALETAAQLLYWTGAKTLSIGDEHR